MAPSDTDDGIADLPATGRRRYLSSLAALAGALSLAGCVGNDDPGTATPTAAGTRTAAATDDPALGDVVETGGLAVVAYSVGRSDDFETLTASDGEGHVVVDVAIKNVGDSEAVGVPFYRGFTLRDGRSTTYGPTALGPTPQLDASRLAPGEVARGYVTFGGVPQDQTGLTLEVAPGAAAAVTIDLESGGSSPPLTHDFAVPVYEVGETVADGPTRFTATGVSTSSGGDTATPAPGNEFVYVDVTVENGGEDDLFFNFLQHAAVKDETGRAYTLSTAAIGAADGDASLTIDPGSEDQAVVGFEVPAATEPLYLVVESGSLGLGPRTLYRLR